MLHHFVPKEVKYFEMFDELATHVVEGSRLLLEMLAVHAGIGAENNELLRKSEAIEALEHQAHALVHETKRELHKSFITPIEREDILLLVTGLGKIIKLTRDVAHTVMLYDFNHIPEQVSNLAQQGLLGCERLRSAISLLSSMDNASQILVYCKEISELESQADRVKCAAMSQLFRAQTDVRELLKYKTIYEQLETITDYCEDVAETVEGVILENS